MEKETSSLTELGIVCIVIVAVLLSGAGIFEVGVRLAQENNPVTGATWQALNIKDIVNGVIRDKEFWKGTIINLIPISWIISGIYMRVLKNKAWYNRPDINHLGVKLNDGYMDGYAVTNEDDLDELMHKHNIINGKEVMEEIKGLNKINYIAERIEERLSLLDIMRRKPMDVKYKLYKLGDSLVDVKIVGPIENTTDFYKAGNTYIRKNSDVITRMAHYDANAGMTFKIPVSQYNEINDTIVVM